MEKAQNIALGRPELEAREEELIHAVEKGNANELITQLPDGLADRVGNRQRSALPGPGGVPADRKGSAAEGLYAFFWKEQVCRILPADVPH